MYTRLPTASMSIGELFAGEAVFSVPIYQRPYSWNVEQAGQLLEDVAFAAGIEEGDPADDDYFLGAILLLDEEVAQPPDTDRQKGASALEIVDGQQRLVTLTVLAAVLRDMESSPESSISQRLAALVTLAAEGRPRWRLMLSGQDQSFFSDYIQMAAAAFKAPDNAESLTTGQTALIEARDHLRQELEKLSAEQRTVLAEFLCDRCHVVVIRTSDIDRAHRIFMVLNDRGRPLQKKDILKAEILKALPVSDRESALGVWSEAEARLGDEMENFFSQLRTAYGFARMPVIAGVRRLVNEAGGAKPFIDSIFAVLAQAYAVILSAKEPASSLTPELRRLLVSLLRLNGREWLPAAMHVMAKVRDPEQAATYLHEIERAAYLMRLNCLGSGKRQTRFARITAAVAARDLPDPATLYEPTREEVRTMAYNLRDLHTRSAPTCRALLMRLNDAVDSNAFEPDLSDYSIEHVLPQRPKAASQWREWFPDGEARLALTGSIGNLMLVDKALNDRARNEDFARKKEVYHSRGPESENLRIAQEVLVRDEWRSDEILAREARLIALINELWRLDLETSALE